MESTTARPAVAAGLEVQRATPDQLDEIVELCGLALGWDSSSPNAEYFRWKHQQNPFGASPIWVATDGDDIVGVRTFLRWEFRQGERVIHAVRAVDTATHPDHRGRGIFTSLTMHAVEELSADGLHFVFNTPNAQSRPGYLKMGWQTAPTPSVSIRPTGPRGAWQIRGARRAADKWSLPTRHATWAPVAFEDTAALEQLLGSLPGQTGLQTNLDPAYLRWRFSFAPLNYRAVTLGDLTEGCLIYRLRTRGTAAEAAVAAILAPESAARRKLLREVRRRSGADYLLALGADQGRGLFPAPGLGPAFTVRALASDPPPDSAWHLHLSDIELL